MSESGGDPFISMISISNHDGSLLDPWLANHKSPRNPQPTKASRCAGLEFSGGEQPPSRSSSNHASDSPSTPIGTGLNKSARLCRQHSSLSPYSPPPTRLPCTRPSVHYRDKVDSREQSV
ncbi:Hypothetical predicted protein [Xyrichtys novacula]|uniref:Uncharacterized protein n=1 Tax=Xyrichtys novacula TaxID=13765 RepID=A0AAV1H3H8_XYRNO|nr:Hypothetical predicted protein [Xyrichtys novacula]